MGFLACNIEDLSVGDALGVTSVSSVVLDESTDSVSDSEVDEVGSRYLLRSYSPDGGLVAFCRSPCRYRLSLRD